MTLSFTSQAEKCVAGKIHEKKVRRYLMQMPNQQPHKTTGKAYFHIFSFPKPIFGLGYYADQVGTGT